MHRVRRDAGLDLTRRCRRPTRPSACGRGSRGPPLPGSRHAPHPHLCRRRRHEPAVQLRDRGHQIRARAGANLSLRHVHRPRRVRVLRGVRLGTSAPRRSARSRARTGRARSRRCRRATYSATSRSPIWRLPRSNRANPNRFVPGSSTLTLGASTGPCRILPSSSRMLRFEGRGKSSTPSPGGAAAVAALGSVAVVAAAAAADGDAGTATSAHAGASASPGSVTHRRHCRTVPDVRRRSRRSDARPIWFAPMRLPLQTQVETVGGARTAGHAAPGAPGPARASRARLPPVGHASPATRLVVNAITRPGPAGRDRRRSGRSPRRARPAHERARARLRRAGLAREPSASAILCRNGSRLRRVGGCVRRSWAADALIAEHVLLRGGAEERCWTASSRGCSSTTRSSRPCRKALAQRAQASLAVAGARTSER